MCVCCASNETGSHLFLHYGFARHLWGLLFGFTGRVCAFPHIVLDFLQIRFVVFGREKEKRMLWKNAVLAIFGVFVPEKCEDFSV